jgi:uncharacterized protein YsxB (DUF464 family)
MWTYNLEKFKDAITVYDSNKLFVAVDFELCYPNKKDRVQTMITWVLDLTKQVMQQRSNDLPDFLEDIVCPLLKDLKDRL